MQIFYIIMRKFAKNCKNICRYRKFALPLRKICGKSKVSNNYEREQQMEEAS